LNIGKIKKLKVLLCIKTLFFTEDELVGTHQHTVLSAEDEEKTIIMKLKMICSLMLQLPLSWQHHFNAS
jgi:hypothetical protein